MKNVNGMLASCAGLAIMAFSTLIGASAMAGSTLDPETRTRLADVTASTAAGGEHVTDEQIARWNESKSDLWAQLFDKPLADGALPVISLDSRPLEGSLISAVTEEGDAVRFVSFEVTPLTVSDDTVRTAVGAQHLADYRESKAEVELVFGFLVTDRGARAVIGVSSTFTDKTGYVETSLVPMVIASRAASQACPIDEAIDFADNVGTQPIDIFNGGQWGFCRCVAQNLKCELYTAGCLLAAPACVVACAAACAGTAGLGCVACIVACAAGGVAICETAYNCWVTACNKGCIPC